MHTHMQHKAPRIAPAGLPPMSHKMLGAGLSVDEPYEFLDQAYGMASALEDALARPDPCAEEILRAAARGVCTLIHLAAIGLKDMDDRREQVAA